MSKNKGLGRLIVNAIISIIYLALCINGGTGVNNLALYIIILVLFNSWFYFLENNSNNKSSKK